MLASYKSSAVATLESRADDMSPDALAAAALRAEAAEAIRWTGLSEADRLARAAAGLLHRFTLPVAGAAAA